MLLAHWNADDAPLWWQEALWDTFTGKYARSHLHALEFTPYSPKQARNKRAEKTRNYRKHSWRRQPMERLS